VERSKDWIFQAQGDLDHARHDVAAEFYDWACFSAQQASEKAVEALLSRLGAESWGHSVTELLESMPESVDLLVVYAGPGREDAFTIVCQHVRVRGLEAHVYSQDEAASVEGTLERMTRNSVTIYPV
jgi:HEPN domain-containing protein